MTDPTDLKKCDVCNGKVSTGIAVVKRGRVTEEYLCRECMHKIFPQAGAETQAFVMHIEKNHESTLSFDAGARGLWKACKVYLGSRGLL